MFDLKQNDFRGSQVNIYESLGHSLPALYHCAATASESVLPEGQEIARLSFTHTCIVMHMRHLSIMWSREPIL